jgi:signal transduction histidine kinase
VSALGDAREALALARKLHDEMGQVLDAVKVLLDAEAADQEMSRLRALSLAMSPKTPDLVGDHVPAEWLDDKENGEPQ